MPRKSSRATDFFRRVGDAVLGIGKLPSKLRRRVKRPTVERRPPPKPKPEVPPALRSFFERRHAGWPEYVMFKVQLAILALFVTAVIHLVFLRAEILVFTPLLLALSVYLAYLTATQLRHAFARDYPAYRSFVGMCLVILWGFVGIARWMYRTQPIGLSPEAILSSLIPPRNGNRTCDRLLRDFQVEVW